MPKANQNFNLQVLNPALSKQWHPTKNIPLTPKDVTQGSNKKAWWVCEKGHEWKAQIYSRAKRGTGCPYCTGRIACYDNCLNTVRPDLSKEWHPTKNGVLTPKDVTSGSSKKVWWLCEQGHEWKISIVNRKNYSRCPYCTGERASEDYNLKLWDPILVKEWHPTMNGALNPEEVTPNSKKKVWWICEKDHEWRAIIGNRVRGAGCPNCAGMVLNDENNLEVLNPKLAKEWHSTKNGGLKPKDVFANSHNRVWWMCKNRHEWRATVFARNKGTNCPVCNSQTSMLELRLLTEIKSIFDTVEHRKKISGIECDLYIPQIRLGIELDSFHYHKDKKHQEIIKNNLLNKQNIKLIRVRERGLGKINRTDIMFTQKENDFIIVGRLLSQIVKTINLPKKYNIRVTRYLNNGILVNNNEYLGLLDRLPSPLPGLSLLECNPSLAKEWHTLKNGRLTPMDVTENSGKRVWWICNDKGHEWQATIASRNYGQGCPYCSNKAVCEDNCLETVNPNLAKQWHPTKNKPFTPKDFVAGSFKKIWWICEKGHEWENRILYRNAGQNCPYCSGRLSCEDNCLQTINPKLAKEWHPTKNKPLTPKNVVPGSHKKVWWICKFGHEWITQVKSRAYGSGCPYCARNIVCDDNCLQTENPSLAKEWNYGKNIDLTPKNVTSGSKNKVWWVCEIGHEWEATVKDRNSGSACPFCAGQISTVKNNLATVNPSLAKQWHSKKNGTLKPKDVLPNSTKSIWWICDKGHEWQTRIWDRSHGQGCPYCAGRSVCEDNCLQTKNPDLAKQWHPKKNDFLTPRDVTPGSDKKVWWLCKNGHEWKANIYQRNNGTACPYCTGKYITEDKCLQTINPKLAKEWHPTKNGVLTPKDFAPNSNKKAWWHCEKGHEWEAQIANRNRGVGCPYCAGKAVCMDNCLQTNNPELSRYWNYSRNGDLTPKDVMPNSRKKVWWICDRGHEWDATISHRNRGSGCPYCAGRKK